MCTYEKYNYSSKVTEILCQDYTTLVLTHPHMGCSRSRWESHFRLYYLSTYVGSYWSWEILFFYSPVLRGYIRKVSIHLVQKYFPHDCSTDSLFCRRKKKWIWWKKYQNETSTRQRQDSVTVSNAIASKIDTQKNKTITVHQQDRDKIFEASH